MGFSGTIGIDSVLCNKSPDLGRRIVFRCIRSDNDYNFLGGRDNSEGNAAPSIKMESMGYWRFRCGLTSGQHVISFDCKQAINSSPRPAIAIKANPSIGIYNDISGIAPSGAGWVNVSVTGVASGNGVVWVHIINRFDSQFKSTPCYFDNFTKT